MTHKFNFTPEELLERKKFLGASEVAAVMRGGEDYYNLWALKTGKIEDVDLSGVLSVQIGRATEELNLAWFTMKTGFNVTGLQRSVIHEKAKFMRANIDGWVDERQAPIEAKCWTWEGHNLTDALLKYTPQMTHQALCTGASRAIVSIIFGFNKWDWGEIEIDGFYAAEMMDRAAEFWSYVMTDKEPPGKPEIVAPIPKEKWVKKDMTGNNSWSVNANLWRENRGPAELFKAAEKDLKALMAPDMGEAWGHGVQIKRDGRGLKITMDNRAETS